MKSYNTLIFLTLACALLLQGTVVNGAPPPNIESAVSIDPQTGFVAVKIFPDPSVAIGANPTSAPVNVTISVSWAVAHFGANLICTRTSTPTLSGWSGTSNLASGSASVTMPATPQTVTLTLSCTGENGNAGNSTNVNVSPSSTNCSTRPPSYNGSPRVLVNRTFFELWNRPFPGAVGEGPTFGLGIQHGTVSAYEFIAPLASVVPFDGYFNVIFRPNLGGIGTIVAGFSECPGEINDLTPNCEGSAGKPRSDWTVRTPPTAFYCPLVPGRTYYYNISVSNAGCIFASGATGAECGFALQSKQYF